MIISLRLTERKYARSRLFVHRIDPMEMFCGWHKVEWVISAPQNTLDGSYDGSGRSLEIVTEAELHAPRQILHRAVGTQVSARKPCTKVDMGCC